MEEEKRDLAACVTVHISWLITVIIMIMVIMICIYYFTLQTFDNPHNNHQGSETEEQYRSNHLTKAI